jgi:Ca-activated chloride channel family protein
MHNKSKDSSSSSEFADNFLTKILSNSKAGQFLIDRLKNFFTIFKQKLHNKKFAAFVSLLGIITLYILGKEIFFTIKSFGKIDDWAYTPYTSIITNISFSHMPLEDKLVLVILLVIVLLNFFTNIKLIWRLFRKYIWTEQSKNVKLFPFKIQTFIGIFSLVITIPLGLFVLRKIPEKSLLVSLIGALLMNILALGYFLFSIVAAIIKLIKKNSNKHFIKRLKVSFATAIRGGMPLLLIPLLLPIVAELRNGSNPKPPPSPFLTSTSSLGPTPYMDNTVGYSTGGSKDINKFRNNIKHNYLPIPSDITYEGLFYDYYFDTGQKEPCNELFCPSYSLAQSSDPLSEEKEYYMSVGLNSGIKKSDFERKKLNVVVVLDISGSMSSGFTNYYYDNMNSGNNTSNQEYKTKIQVARESLASLLEHLDSQDRFGVVLYESTAHLAKPLNKVAKTDIRSIQNHIMDIQPTGGTNMGAGLTMATEMLQEYTDVNSDEYENRIIFLTDAMPNTGVTADSDILSIAQENAEHNIYSTYIGIGVDFNSDLITKITKVEGGNYYSVHSSEDFKYRMTEGFDYMVTPLVFDLNLKMESDKYQIKEVYGSPEADKSTGEIMQVNTLFPSDSKEHKTKGGIILLELEKKNGSEQNTTASNTINRNTTEEIVLSVSYKDRNGNQKSNKKIISQHYPNNDENYYENSGIQKAILLTRYASLLKTWIIETQEALAKVYSENPSSTSTPSQTTSSVNKQTGIPTPPQPRNLETWELKTTPLQVPSHYRQVFADFKVYYEEEMNDMDDDTLERELEILNILSTIE